MSRVWQLWRVLWFRPVSARGIAVLRIGLGLVLLDQLVALWPALERLVGPNGMVSVDAARHQLPVGRWTPLDAIQDPMLLHGLMALAVLAAVAFVLGWKSRFAGLFCVVFQAWLYQRNPFFMNGGDRVLRLGILYLCAVPCGATWSLDAWLKARKSPLTGPASPLVPATATWLIRLQLCVIYAWSGAQKAATEVWQQGDALYYALSSGNYARFPHWVDSYLAEAWVQGFLRLSSWGTLGWECSFALLVLWPRTRRVALVCGLLFHLGIFVTMSVGTFSTATPLLLLAWLDPAWADRIGSRNRDKCGPRTRAVGASR
jgi:uncharacterized membrane protein YphA (DoxX/SURF4 family)